MKTRRERLLQSIRGAVLGIKIVIFVETRRARKPPRSVECNFCAVFCVWQE